jgi:hypothetical protein
MPRAAFSCCLSWLLVARVLGMGVPPSRPNKGTLVHLLSSNVMQGTIFHFATGGSEQSHALMLLGKRPLDPTFISVW